MTTAAADTQGSLRAGEPAGHPVDKRPLWLCVALSVFAHGALLVYQLPPLRGQEAASPAARGEHGAAAATMRVRVVPQPTVTASGDERIDKARRQDDAPKIENAAALPQISPSPSHPLASRVPGDTAARPDSESRPPEPEATAALSNGPPESGGESPSAGFDGSGYIPRAQLTVPPSPLATIQLGIPEGDFTARRYAGVLALYIDEEGHVRHAEAEGTSLPPAFEQVARDAFMAAAFVPGELEGRRVKSRMRVEVVFEAATE